MPDHASSMLDRFRSAPDELARNRMLFDWLRDDDRRAALYAELRDERFPVLRFKSVARTGGDAPWPSEDVYLVSSCADIAASLQGDSVEPYSHLGSGGRFMLGLDDVRAHRAQRDAALRALRFERDEICACTDKAIERALVQPLKDREFDLVAGVAERVAIRFAGVAERVAIHFAALLFGLSTKSHVVLAEAMRASYLQLVFEIVGRHFVAETGLPSAGSEKARELADQLDAFVREAATGPEDEGLDRTGLPTEGVIQRLYRDDGAGARDPVFIALGLIAGTIGNFKAAVAIAIDRFFRHHDLEGRPLIEAATLAARSADPCVLDDLIRDALAADPPAPFLARRSRAAVAYVDEKGRCARIPDGERILLAIGADPGRTLMFGGNLDDPAFMHRCIGQQLIWPLVVATIRSVLQLPGLARVVDAHTGKPMRLTKRWGAVCESFALQYQRDRRLNQQPLHFVMRIKPPVAENAERLKLLTQAGAHVVEETLRESRHVHFAWFHLIDNETQLLFSTVYDGDFDAYVEHFALKVPLFDEQFKYLEDAPPTPIRKHPKEFVETIRRHNCKPLGGYFFSAYPLASVADIHNAGIDPP